MAVVGRQGLGLTNPTKPNAVSLNYTGTPPEVVRGNDLSTLSSDIARYGRCEE